MGLAPAWQLCWIPDSTQMGNEPCMLSSDFHTWTEMDKHKISVKKCFKCPMVLNI